MQVDQVAFVQVDDLVGHAGQGHRVAGQEMLATALAHTEHEGRAGARADHAVRFVLAEHRDRIRAMQLGDGGLHRLEQVTFVQAVHQVGNDFGVGLAGKHIATGLQAGAQFVVVFDDAVVNQGDATCAVRWRGARAMTEMRVGVVHRRRAVRGPTRVGDARGADQAVGRHLLHQFRHPLGAARALEAARVDGHAARVIAAVFEPLQALHEDGDDVAVRDRGDDATHGGVTPSVPGL